MKDRQQGSTAHPISFLMILASDHISGATGLVSGSSLTVTISKDGAAFAAPVGTITELADGWYTLAGNATDRGTLGEFKLHATGTGCDPCDVDCAIVGYDPFDAAALGLTRLDAAVSSRSIYAGGAVASVTAPVTAGTVTDKTGYSLTTAPPTVGAITTAVVAGMASAPVGSVANIAAQTGDSYAVMAKALVYLTGVVGSSPSNSSITITPDTALPSGAVGLTFTGLYITFRPPGVLAPLPKAPATYTVTSTTVITVTFSPVLPAAPGVGDPVTISG